MNETSEVKELSDQMNLSFLAIHECIILIFLENFKNKKINDLRSFLLKLMQTF